MEETVEVVVGGRWGLHARPATRLVSAALEYESQLFLEHDGRQANCKSLVALMKLGLSGGSTVLVRGTGPDAPDAVKRVAELLRVGLEE